MAPPIPTLSPSAFTLSLGVAEIEALKKCPLKEISQYDCVPLQRLPVSGTTGAPENGTSSPSNLRNSRAPAGRNTGDNLRPKMLCTEFVRYFRRCADIGQGPNVEVTSLMGLKKPKSGSDGWVPERTE